MNSHDAALIRSYPELRNPRYMSFFKLGRDKRRELGTGADIPLFSYNATWQSIFTKGWRSVDEWEYIPAHDSAVRPQHIIGLNSAVGRVIAKYGRRA